MADVSNRKIAQLFDRTAELLTELGDNEFRIRSYHKAADELRHSRRNIAELYREQGAEGVESIPGIGERLAGSIGEIVETGRFGLLDRLEGEVAPEKLFTRLPGVGPELAERIHAELEVETLEELEQAAHDGRLVGVEGIGRNKLEGIQHALAGMLSRSAMRQARQRTEQPAEDQRPAVGVVLDVDREYRDRAAAGQLRTIAPHRFNPTGEAWLPILATERGNWRVRALFSNTQRAHELDKTHDWVVIYYQSDDAEGQCTVVTATGGDLQGRRVVRGREAECRRYYRSN